MSTDLVTLDIADGVAEIALNRPEKMNAITVDLIRAMEAAAAAAAGDGSVRAAVLRGHGRAFCAGLDKDNFARMLTSGAGSLGGSITARTHGDANLFQQAALMWRKLPVPVIAALHGVALGGGFQIAMGADIRIGAPNLRMSILEMKWGLIPDMGGMALMRHLARGDVIRKLIYTAETFGAEDAAAHGFITEIAADPLARARDLAREIAGKSPSAMRAAKALANIAEESDPPAILMAESEFQKDLIGAPHQIESVMAGLQGRAAKYD